MNTKLKKYYINVYVNNSSTESISTVLLGEFKDEYDAMMGMAKLLVSDSCIVDQDKQLVIRTKAVSFLELSGIGG